MNQGRNTPSSSLRPNPIALPLLRARWALLPTALLPLAALANPIGGSVVAGQASISNAGSVTTIQQNSASAVINWQQFNVAGGERVQFLQPAASAAVLNRVVGGNASEILGNVTSNGRVFLVNPQGVMFGAGSRIDVGSLVATTLDLRDADFMAGRYVLSGDASPGAVRNDGVLTARDGGFIVLAGGDVRNGGLIQTRLGDVVLASGSGVTLDLNDSGLVSYQIDAAALADKAGVINTGSLLADGGRVVMTARMAQGLAATAVNNTGLVRATGIAEQDGVIVLEGLGGNTVNSGTLDASHATGHGGQVNVLGDRDVLMTGGLANASGALGGGTVRVGGGWQGGEGLTEARRTYLAPQAVLRADALEQGDGGSIALWSGAQSVALGLISARGAGKGQGGAVETSSHGHLQVTRAPEIAGGLLGRAGRWLIDPVDLTITAGEGQNTSSTSDKTGDTLFKPTTAPSELSVDTLLSALQGGDVEVTTVGSTGAGHGDITLATPLDFGTLETNRTLTLHAAGDLILNEAILANAPPPPSPNPAPAAFAAAAASPATPGLSLVLDAGGGIQFNNGINTNGGALTATALNGGISSVNPSGTYYTLNASDITLSAASGDVLLPYSALSAAGRIDVISKGDSHFNGLSTYFYSNISPSDGTVTRDASVSVTSGGNIWIAGGVYTNLTEGNGASHLDATINLAADAGIAIGYGLSSYGYLAAPQDFNQKDGSTSVRSDITLTAGTGGVQVLGAVSTHAEIEVASSSVSQVLASADVSIAVAAPDMAPQQRALDAVDPPPLSNIYIGEGVSTYAYIDASQASSIVMQGVEASASVDVSNAMGGIAIDGLFDDSSCDYQCDLVFTDFAARPVMPWAPTSIATYVEIDDLKDIKQLKVMDDHVTLETSGTELGDIDLRGSIEGPGLPYNIVTFNLASSADIAATEDVDESQSVGFINSISLKALADGSRLLAPHISGSGKLITFEASDEVLLDNAQIDGVTLHIRAPTITAALSEYDEPTVFLNVETLSSIGDRIDFSGAVVTANPGLIKPPMARDFGIYSGLASYFAQSGYSGPAFLPNSPIPDVFIDASETLAFNEINGSADYVVLRAPFDSIAGFGTVSSDNELFLQFTPAAIDNHSNFTFTPAQLSFAHNAALFALGGEDYTGNITISLSSGQTPKTIDSNGNNDTSYVFLTEGNVSGASTLNSSTSGDVIVLGTPAPSPEPQPGTPSPPAPTPPAPTPPAPTPPAPTPPAPTPPAPTPPTPTPPAPAPVPTPTPLFPPDRNVVLLRDQLEGDESDESGDPRGKSLVTRDAAAQAVQQCDAI